MHTEGIAHRQVLHDDEAGDRREMPDPARRPFEGQSAERAGEHLLALCPRLRHCFAGDIGQVGPHDAPAVPFGHNLVHEVDPLARPDLGSPSADVAAC